MQDDICIEYTPAYAASHDAQYWERYEALMQQARTRYGAQLKMVFGLDGFYVADFRDPLNPSKPGPYAHDRLGALEGYLKHYGSVQ